jgi:hypothetical protein
MTNIENRQMENTSEPDWKRYPYAIGDDPELSFPDAEGDQGAESNTYYVAGRLTGRSSGRRWAFFVIFTFNDIWHRLRADFRTMALFDLESGDYGTSTEFDFPRLFRRRRDHRLSVAPGHLDVSFRGDRGETFWRTRRGADGALEAFSYALGAIGVDAAGRTMRLDLDLETRKPPLPVGGKEYGGIKTCMGQHGTHSYFQSDVRFQGKIAWGDVEEEVDGDCGWIDRQWSPRYLGVHNGLRNTRYRHEWREIHLDDGIEMSVWMHFDRGRANRMIPFSGVTAAGPAGEIDSTTDFSVERLSFVRDPGSVVPRYPLAGAKYFTDRYRLRIPAWDLDLISEPLVAKPAHALPIEYWSGPTRIRGTLAGRPATGFGFHERTLAFARDFELVDVLRQTLLHLPREAYANGRRTGEALANLVWEVDGFLSHGDNQEARRYLLRRIRPELGRLADPARALVMAIADDLADALFRWWVRP